MGFLTASLYFLVACSRFSPVQTETFPSRANSVDEATFLFTVHAE